MRSNNNNNQPARSSLSADNFAHPVLHQRIGTEEMAGAFDDDKENFLRRHREYSAQLAAGDLVQRNRMELLRPPPEPEPKI